MGVRITALRKEKGLSQTALGQAIGVTFQQVQKYERGQNRVGARRLSEIAELLGVAISALFEDASLAERSAELNASCTAPGMAQAYAVIADEEVPRALLVLARALARGGSV